MKILSIDAGAIQMGISLMEDNKITKKGTVRIVPFGMHFGQYKKLYGAKMEGLLVRNFLEFATKSKKWSPEFKTTDKLIFESQRIHFTHALTYGLNGWLYTINPKIEIIYVHPFSMSRRYKIGGLTRAQRKKKIKEIVVEKMGKTDFLKHDLMKPWSQDAIDSVLNIFYYLEGNKKTKKKFLEPCPFWSCD